MESVGSEGHEYVAFTFSLLRECESNFCKIVIIIIKKL
jgi:hypothetical protein